ncbi:uncharacterized protein LOC143056005 [Mytilus galloprovincialis]|uniref:uncharacterized protein LOC143056005 n=1 Tax=Mytilus galloprovincialis TaxID=29158 RepID=UPI003F7B59C8
MLSVFVCVCSTGYTGKTCKQALTTTHALTTGAGPLLPLGPNVQLPTALTTGAGPLLPFGPNAHLPTTTGAGPLLPFGPNAHLPTTTGSGPLLPSGPHGKRSKRVCNRVDLLMDLASGKSVMMNGALECFGKSASALVMKHCKAPSRSEWKKGIHIKDSCPSIGNYVPAAQWINGDLQSIAGVVVSCSSTGIKMISQVCGGHISLSNITSPLLDTLYVVDWN